MINIIISDEFGSHGEAIKQAISVGYGNDISNRIQIIGYWQPAFVEARDNLNIVALIRSMPGVFSYVNDAQSIYPRVQTFFPLGSNTFEQLNIFAEQDPPVIVTSGAGDTEGRNNTGYGNGLEFWDDDMSPESTPDDWSSYSNGIVLGKLLKIKETLNCTWWEARFRARMTADRIEPNRQTSPWDLRNGYGKINVDNAIAYTGIISADPYVIDDLTSQITALNAEITALNAEITALNAEIADLMQDKATLQMQITTLESNIMDLQAVIDSLGGNPFVPSPNHQQLISITNSFGE